MWVCVRFRLATNEARRSNLDGVLPLIKDRYDVTLIYAGVTDWRLPIKDSDIAKEIPAGQEPLTAFRELFIAGLIESPSDAR